MKGGRFKFLALIAAPWFAAASASAHGATVFRCVQPDGSALYTDVPCPGGGPIEIHPGTPDPAAVERLARAQAVLDAAAARRKSDLARASAQRELSGQIGDAAAGSASAAPQEGDVATSFGYGYGYAPIYGGVRKPRPPRPRPLLPPPEKRVVRAQAKHLPTINLPGVRDVERIPR